METKAAWKDPTVNLRNRVEDRAPGSKKAARKGYPKRLSVLTMR